MRNHVQLADAYYRLSDEERKYGESASITNQRTIVREYCEKHGIILVEEFVDDGFSGGNFERPGFQAMLEHLRTGKANMVITKDLSRLGRDMTESSHYAERYFPEHGIRYLAPGSNFDSQEDNLMAPFQFAMNDVYLRDTSRKVKQTLNTKRNNGKYVACPPYGYRKAERTTDQLVPDENTAPVVKKIFDLAASGQSCRSIAIRLNEACIMPPLKYRVECRDNFTERGAQRASDEWNYTTVKRILRNRVYLGHTLLGKSRKVSVKSKKKVIVPEEEWVFYQGYPPGAGDPGAVRPGRPFHGGEHQGQRRKPSLPPQHLRRHCLLRLLRRGHVLWRLRLQRRTGEILVFGVQQPEFPSTDPLPTWGAYSL